MDTTGFVAELSREEKHKSRMIPMMLAAAPGRTGGDLSTLKEESVGRDQESGFGWVKMKSHPEAGCRESREEG